MNEGGEKRFDPTPARRERAKREGNVVRSTELAGSGAFAGGLVSLAGIWPLLSSAAVGAVRDASRSAALELLALGFVPALGAALGGIGATLGQSGGLHVNGLSFAPGRLAPKAGLQRMLGADALVAAARATLAFVVVAAALVPAVLLVVAHAATPGSLVETALTTRTACVQVCVVAGGVGALFAVADYLLVRRRWLHSLRMSLEELKRDLREQDGDPQAKSRRRQIHRAFARGGIARTTEAALVVVNPTHLAIALRYGPPSVPVPEIVVRASGEPAREVRALAERAGIPVVQDRPLARLLFRVGEAGRPIPPECFVAVAQVIAALLQSGALEA